jgi:hypothetical protein
MTIQLLGQDYIGISRIVARIDQAISAQEPYSLVRIGDGENIVLAQEGILSQEWISTNVGWSHSNHYCGITLPNLGIRDRMVEAIKEADTVGVFAGDKLTEQIFNFYEIQPKSICYAFDNVYMPMFKPFVELIIKNPPLLVGNPARRFADLLYEKLGVKVPGTVEINNYEEIDRCLKEMTRIHHQWSLVSAGVNAVIIAATMANKWGKVSIDFGHAPDNVMAPNYPDYWLAPV